MKKTLFSQLVSLLLALALVVFNTSCSEETNDNEIVEVPDTPAVDEEEEEEEEKEEAYVEQTSWAVGDIVYDTATGETALGMIIWVDETDDSIAMALSLEVSNCKYDTAAPDTQPFIFDDTAYRMIGAGDDCYKELKSSVTSLSTYEIFVWAQSLGSEWYIPTVWDLRDVVMPAFQEGAYATEMDAYEQYPWEGTWGEDALNSDLNQALVTAGGYCIALSDLGYDYTDASGSARYWTCNTTSTGSKARAFRTSDNNFSWTSFSFDNTAPYARAVRYINM